MCKLRLLTSAWSDLTKIEDWYTLEFSAQTGAKVVDSILKSLDRLELFPDSGSPVPDKRLSDQGYRMVLSGQYVSIYRVMGRELLVYRIANTKTEYTRLFDGQHL